MIPIFIALFALGIYANSSILTYGAPFGILANIISHLVRRRKSVEIGPLGMVIINGNERTALNWQDIATITRTRGTPAFGFLEIKTNSNIYHQLSDDLAELRVVDHIKKYKSIT
jgi:hypothetical protein